jgi:hypothetical protein
MTRRSVVPALPVGQQGTPARAAASAVGALRSARGSHLRRPFSITVTIKWRPGPRNQRHYLPMLQSRDAGTPSTRLDAKREY